MGTWVPIFTEIHREYGDPGPHIHSNLTLSRSRGEKSFLHGCKIKSVVRGYIGSRVKIVRGGGGGGGGVHDSATAHAYIPGLCCSSQQHTQQPLGLLSPTNGNGLQSGSKDGLLLFSLSFLPWLSAPPVKCEHSQSNIIFQGCYTFKSVQHYHIAFPIQPDIAYRPHEYPATVPTDLPYA